MGYITREDGWCLVAHSHIWNDGFRDIEMKGKELRIAEMRNIEYGELLVDYQGNFMRIPVEKLMFDRRDLINEDRY